MRGKEVGMAREGVGGEENGERKGREGVHNLRKTTPRHQMAGYGPAVYDRPGE